MQQQQKIHEVVRFHLEDAWMSSGFSKKKWMTKNVDEIMMDEIMTKFAFNIKMVLICMSINIT